MRRKERSTEVNSRLAEEYSGARIALSYESDFQLLASVILSAQTTDVTVNKVTPGLFDAYPDSAALSSADIEDVERLIKPTGFYHNKAKNIVGAARMIEAEFGGEVPSTMGELIRLPGVARKTANIVLFNAFGILDGIAVDTHVMRLSKRLNFSGEKDAVKVERDLMTIFPQEEWGMVTYRLIEHGRAVCDARRPICGQCLLSDICPSAFKVKGWRKEGPS